MAEAKSSNTSVTPLRVCEVVDSQVWSPSSSGSGSGALTARMKHQLFDDLHHRCKALERRRDDKGAHSVSENLQSGSWFSWLMWWWIYDNRHVGHTHTYSHTHVIAGHHSLPPKMYQRVTRLCLFLPGGNVVAQRERPWPQTATALALVWLVVASKYLLPNTFPRRRLLWEFHHLLTFHRLKYKDVRKLLDSCWALPAAESRTYNFTPPGEVCKPFLGQTNEAVCKVNSWQRLTFFRDSVVNWV